MVSAFYEAEIGIDGNQVTRHELKKMFRLPEHVTIGEVCHQLKPDGTLFLEIILEDEPTQPNYRCSVTTEDVTNNSK